MLISSRIHKNFMNLASILKMFGVKISPEQVKKLEEVIPRIPAIVAEVVCKVDSHIAHTDMRLMAIEARLERIEHGLERNDSDGGILPAGTGATERELAGIGVNGAD